MSRPKGGVWRLTEPRVVMLHRDQGWIVVHVGGVEEGDRELWEVRVQRL